MEPLLIAIPVILAVVAGIGYLLIVINFLERVASLWRRFGPSSRGLAPRATIAGADIETMPYESDLGTALEAAVRNYFARGRQLQRQERHEAAIAEFEKAFAAAHNESERAALHILIGNSLLQLSRIPEAEGRYRQAIALAEDAADSKGQAVGLANLGIVRGRKGELNHAIQDYNSSLALYDPNRDQLERAITLGDLAIVLVDKGEADKAEQHHKEALAILQDIKDPVCQLRQANQLGRLGYLYAQRGKLDQARHYYQESLKIHERNNYRLGQANQLGGLATINAARGALSDAEDQYKKALTILKALKNPIGQARQLGGLGNVYLQRRELDKAEEYHRKALEIDEEIGNRLGQAQDLGNLGNVYFRRGGQTDKARSLLNQAKALYEAIGAGGEGPETVRAALERLEAAEKPQEQPKPKPKPKPKRKRRRRKPPPKP